MLTQRLSDTTPPQQTKTFSSSSSFKSLMNEMAELFPKLPQKFQEQARQAHSHVQLLMREGENEQAVSLMTHMRDIMRSLASDVQEVPLAEEAAPPPPTFSSQVIDTVPAIPPLPPTSSPEMIALQRSLQDLQMKVKESASISLIAKRVRDMDMEQKYFQLEERLKGLKESVNARLGTIASLSESASALARREARKRTVSKNPFCEHEATGFCEFCVGREIDEPTFPPMTRESPVASPPPLMGAAKDDLVTIEMVTQMQQTLRSYQSTLKELLKQRKQEIMSSK
jgi:hypothetical protein